MSAIKTAKKITRATRWDGNVEEGTSIAVHAKDRRYCNSLVKIFTNSAYRFQLAGYRDATEYSRIHPSLEVSTSV